MGAVGMVLTGRLIPRSVHRDRIADLQAQVATWRTAHGLEVQRADLMSSQVDKLLAQGDTTVALLRALPQPPAVPSKDSVS